MNNEINILILSCGTRNKIVEYFKETLDGRGKIIATDCNDLAPALYEADEYYIVPRITEDNYLDKIFDICKKEKITAVLSLIDPELSILAKEKKKFLEIGVKPLVSDYEVVENCYNKYDFYQTLKAKDIPTVETFNNLDDFNSAKILGKIDFPVFVKPVQGSASIDINKVNNQAELEVLFAKHDDLIVQEFMSGQECGADIYIDFISGKVIQIYTKEKILMRAGETDKSVSFENKKLFELLEKFVKCQAYIGAIDVDIFEKDGEYYISEVNPRFGGGYPHTHEAGCNYMEYIINNLLGLSNKSVIGEYEVGTYMMKYNEIMMK